MKISMVLGHELPFPPTGGGGVNSLLNALTKAFARAGHEVVAYSPAFEGASSEEEIDSVLHIRVPGAERHPNNLRNQVRSLPYIFRLRQVLRPCDVLSCHLLTSFMFKPHRNAKIVTHTIHRDPKLFLALMGNLDRIYTGTAAITADAAANTPWLSHKIKTVHNCVDFNGYEYFIIPKNRDFTFIYVGRFSRDKGIETLIRAFIAAATQSRSNIRLQTVGPLTAEKGAEPDFVIEMRKLAAASSVGDRIEIFAPIYERAKLDDLVRKADIVCLPSLGGETLNMSILECLRLSRPVLISDLPANLPLVAHGTSGFLAKAGDVGSWSRAMLDLAGLNDEDYEILAHNAFKFGLMHFASDAIAAKYVEDFEQLLNGK